MNVKIIIKTNNQSLELSAGVRSSTFLLLVVSN